MVYTIENIVLAGMVPGQTQMEKIVTTLTVTEKNVDAMRGERFVVVANLYDEFVPNVWPGLFPTVEAAQEAVLASCRSFANDETLELDWELDGDTCFAEFADQVTYTIAGVV